jgi:transcriptional regulator with XRE-family HTH domain
MVGRKRDLKLPEPELYWGLTPNQVIAFNLARAREMKGWTLNEAAEALEPYVGSRWSKANLSAAERSITGERIRNFDADEIVAFARAFEVPIAFFFLPPPPWAGELAMRLKTPDAEQLGIEIGALIDLLYGDPFQANFLNQRMQLFLDQAGGERLTHAQQQIAWAVKDRINAILYSAFGDLADLEGLLRKAADQLVKTQVRARKEVQQEFGVDGSPQPEGKRP